jgi:hypothetical protein
MHLCLTHQAPFNLLHRKSKLSGFDKSGAWPMLVNFQPWPQTPVPLGLVVYNLEAGVLVSF